MDRPWTREPGRSRGIRILRPTRYRVSLIAPRIATRALPPISYWFLERQDAEMIAGLSARECPAVALVEYPERGEPRLVRFHGSDEDRDRFLAEALGHEGDGQRPPAFFASSPMSAHRRTAA